MAMDFKVKEWIITASMGVVSGNPWVPRSTGFLFVVQSALHIHGSISADSVSLQKSICSWLNLRKQNLWIWRADTNSQVWASGKKMTFSDKVVFPRWSPISKDSKKTVGSMWLWGPVPGRWCVTDDRRHEALSSQGYKITSLNSIIIPTHGT